MKYTWFILAVFLFGSCSSNDAEEIAPEKVVKQSSTVDNRSTEEFFGTFQLDSPLDYKLEIYPDGRVFMTAEGEREGARWEWVEKGKSMNWIGQGKTMKVYLEWDGDLLRITDDKENLMRYVKVSDELPEDASSSPIPADLIQDWGLSGRWVLHQALLEGTQSGYTVLTLFQKEESKFALISVEFESGKKVDSRELEAAENCELTFQMVPGSDDIFMISVDQACSRGDTTTVEQLVLTPEGKING